MLSPMVICVSFHIHSNNTPTLFYDHSLYSCVLLATYFLWHVYTQVFVPLHSINISKYSYVTFATRDMSHGIQCRVKRRNGRWAFDAHHPYHPVGWMLYGKKIKYTQVHPENLTLLVQWCLGISRLATFSPLGASGELLVRCCHKDLYWAASHHRRLARLCRRRKLVEVPSRQACLQRPLDPGHEGLEVLVLKCEEWLSSRPKQLLGCPSSHSLTTWEPD